VETPQPKTDFSHTDTWFLSRNQNTICRDPRGFFGYMIENDNYLIIREGDMDDLFQFG